MLEQIDWYSTENPNYKGGETFDTSNTSKNVSSLKNEKLFLYNSVLKDLEVVYSCFDFGSTMLKTQVSKEIVKCPLSPVFSIYNLLKPRISPSQEFESSVTCLDVFLLSPFFTRDFRGLVCKT